MNNSNDNNNNCYFSIDSTFQGNVAAGNVQTNDVSAQSIESTDSFSITTPGTAAFKGSINVAGLTSVNALTISSQQNSASINLNGNRLSNVAQPKDDSSPVPANYLRSPEYFFCSLKVFGRININSSSPVPILGPARTSYQTHDIFSHIRFVDYNNKQSTVTYPGTQAVQLLSKGFYMIDVGLNKRWGWDNGWGGSIHLLDGADTMYSSNTIYSGGGYSGQASLSTSVHIKEVMLNPNDNLTDVGKKQIFRTLLRENDAVLGAFYFGIIFFPEAHT
ncbi:conserved hypothetical protein [Chlamydia felis Fe/C-56]|uniref:Uncharacterized protein n=1 Tax=Chlamydia felis (strain Fe/C-56) TaxID=264202 RepID=Q254N1_CHLFF|nr:hypothetical protein [Chlamydia felis]BAE81257.1 conserved hypothetical protein [Chlamydia felis Fe/C-56]